MYPRDYQPLNYCQRRPFALTYKYCTETRYNIKQCVKLKRNIIMWPANNNNKKKNKFNSHGPVTT